MNFLLCFLQYFEYINYYHSTLIFLLYYYLFYFLYLFKDYLFIFFISCDLLIEISLYQIKNSLRLNERMKDTFDNSLIAIYLHNP